MLERAIALILAVSMQLGAAGCTGQPTPQPDDEAGGNTAEASAAVTSGTQTDRGFLLDNVLHDPTEGDIHYNVYIPDSYDGTVPYAVFFTLPGYEGLYFQGVGANLQEDFGFAAQDYHADMIVVAPQLSDWGETSARADHCAGGVFPVALQHWPKPCVRQRLFRRRRNHVARHGDAARSVYCLPALQLAVGRRI